MKKLFLFLTVLALSIGNVWGAQNVTFGTAVSTKGYVYSSSTVADNTMLSDKCVYYSSAKNTVSLSSSKIIAYRLSLIFELSSSAKVDAVIGKNKNKDVSYVLYSLTSTQYDFIKSMSGVSNDVATAYVALDASHPMKTLFKDASISANDASRQKLLSAVDVDGVTTKLYTSGTYTTSTSAETTIPIWKSATGDEKDVLSAGYYAIYIDCGSSSGNTLDNLTFTAAAACANPNASIIDEAAGFVGDAVDLEFSSDNTSAADTVVTLDAAAATEGVDYEFVEEGFKPLTSGEFEITISQAKDNAPTPHCAVEESVTLTISAKTPVTDFTIPASTSARKGQEVNLSITNLDAAATKIGWILAGDTVSKTANYAFTPNAAGSYVFTAYAANEFNTSGSFEKTCTITVAISDDATLSALSVTGKTLDPTFNAGVFSYSVGEIGVYEKLTINYTIHDAGYATAVLKNKITTDGQDTVVVTAEDGTTRNEYIINYNRATATELASISDDATWDWTKTGETSTLQLSTSTSPTKSEEFVFADVLRNTPDASFKANSIAGVLEYVYREESSIKFCQGPQLKFITTVPGTLSVTYSNTSDRTSGSGQSRYLIVNGVQYGDSTLTKTHITTSNIAINPGEVILTGKEKKSGSIKDLRFSKVVFTATRYTVTYTIGEHGECATASEEVISGTTATLPAVTANTGYTFNGWFDASTAGTKVGVAGDKATITKDSTLYAQYSAIQYDVTLLAGTNALTAGAATVDYDATSLAVTTATTGTGTLLGYYTAASDGTLVADKDGKLVDGNVTGFVTAGKWSLADDATLFAVYDGVPTALDNTVEETKAIKRIENGQVVIFKDGKYFNVLGIQIR